MQANGQEHDSQRTTILTRYIGPTNRRGSRIVADAGLKRRVILDYQPGLSSDQNHDLAARGLAMLFKWKGDLIKGHMENGRAYVFLPDKIQETISTAHHMKAGYYD